MEPDEEALEGYKALGEYMATGGQVLCIFYQHNGFHDCKER